MLTFDEYNQYVVDHITKFLPETLEIDSISLNKINKNNEELTGLVIKEKDINISPTLYLDSFYELYSHEGELDISLSKISDIYLQHRMPMNFDLDYIKNFEAVMDKIQPRVIGIENNEKILSESPHRTMDGIAVIYAIELDAEASKGLGSISSIRVTDQMMKAWGSTQDEIDNIAVNNLCQNTPVFKSLSQVIQDSMFEQFLKECNNDEIQAQEMLLAAVPVDMIEDSIFVLTNDAKVHGANCILNTVFMDSLVEKYGEFYILPSSIHETLIIPNNPDFTLDRLSDMVRQVNETEVSTQDRLSDHVLKYDPVLKEIYCAENEALQQEKRENLSQEEGPLVKGSVR